MTRQAAETYSKAIGAQWDSRSNKHRVIWKIPSQNRYAKVVPVAAGYVEITFHSECPCGS